MTTYRVRRWGDHYETYESRRLKTMQWVAMPTKHDGKTFRRVMRLDSSGALYGVWCLMVQVAAKCPTRGTLADADGPLTALDIADKTDLSEETVQSAMNVFASDAIRWIEIVPPEESAGVPASTAGTPVLQDSTRQDKDPPLPPKGGTLGKRGKRKRDGLTPITPTQLRDAKSILTWVRENPRIDRDAGTVGYVLAAALQYQNPNDFTSAVESGLDGDWRGLTAITQKAFSEARAAA